MTVARRDTTDPEDAARRVDCGGLPKSAYRSHLAGRQDGMTGSDGHAHEFLVLLGSVVDPVTMAGIAALFGRIPGADGSCHGPSQTGEVYSLAGLESAPGLTGLPLPLTAGEPFMAYQDGGTR